MCQQLDMHIHSLNAVGIRILTLVIELNIRRVRTWGAGAYHLSVQSVYAYYLRRFSASKIWILEA